MTSRFLSISLFMLFGLFACSESDVDSADNASAPVEPVVAPVVTAEEAKEEMTSAPAMAIEKAEGVVYQDEIYANWPYN